MFRKMITVWEKKCQVPWSETNKMQDFILFTWFLEEEMTLFLFSHQGRLPERGSLSAGSWKGLEFDKWGWMRQEITGVREQTKQNFSVWKAGGTVKVLSLKKFQVEGELCYSSLKKKNSVVGERAPSRVKLTILTFKRSNFKILCVWQNLLIDRVQKFTETCVPEGSYYFSAKPKGKHRF